MWPELCARRLVTSPVTQTRPSSFSSRRFTCDVNSLTVSTRRVGSVGNNSPKSHWDLELRGIWSGNIDVRRAESFENRLRGAADRSIGIRQRRLQCGSQFRPAESDLVHRQHHVDSNPVIAVVQNSNQVRTEPGEIEIRIIERIML